MMSHSCANHGIPVVILYRDLFSLLIIISDCFNQYSVQSGSVDIKHMYLYTATHMLSISYCIRSALSIMQYGVACAILLTQSAQGIVLYSADAKRVKKSLAPNTVVACSLMSLCTSSSGTAGWSNTKSLTAIEITATFSFSSSIFS